MIAGYLSVQQKRCGLIRNHLLFKGFFNFKDNIYDCFSALEFPIILDVRPLDIHNYQLSTISITLQDHLFYIIVIYI